MRHDETEDHLPPTQRRGRNAWDAIAEIARVLGRGLSGLGRALVTPGGIILIVVALVAFGLLSPEKVDQLMTALAGLVDKIKK